MHSLPSIANCQQFAKSYFSYYLRGTYFKTNARYNAYFLHIFKHLSPTDKNMIIHKLGMIIPHKNSNT
jgi:hypothetical protein